MSLLKTLIGMQPIRPDNPASALGQLCAIAYPSRLVRERKTFHKVGRRMAQIMELLSDGLRHSTLYIARKLGISMDSARKSLRCMRLAHLVRKAGAGKLRGRVVNMWVRA